MSPGVQILSPTGLILFILLFSNSRKLVWGGGGGGRKLFLQLLVLN